MDVPIMFHMEGAIPTRDVTTLRMSRMAVLHLLIAFGMQVAEGLKDSGKSLVARVVELARVSRWIRVAIFLSARIDDGALDGPRPPKKLRVRKPAADKAADKDDDAEPREVAEALMREPREYEHLECYLDRPFGEVVALICKGLGMTPDWAAWADEPWAQEEIRTQPPTSPYFTGVPLEAPPPPRPDPTRPRLPAPPPPNRKARRAKASKARKRPPSPSRGRRWLAQRDG